MSSSDRNPVLIIGGAGIVGSRAAATLRQLYPELPITIGGRDMVKARAVADAIGGADIARIDLERADLGLAAHQAFSAVVVFLKDDTLHSLDFAQAHGLPYLGISTGVFEMGPEVARHVYRPASAPILMANQWLVGAVTLPTLHFAADFRTIESIEITGVLDERDMGGPAAYVDFDRFTTAAPNALYLKDGRWRWTTEADATRVVTAVDGVEMQARAYSPFDVLTLGTATGARSVRFDYVYGESVGRRRGEGFSTDMIIEIAGERTDGAPERVRWDVVHPAGQAPVTALGVALGVEGLLGLRGGLPAVPGLYFPERLIEPAYALERLEEFGLRITRRVLTPARTAA